MIYWRAIGRSLWLAAALPWVLNGGPAMARSSDHWPRLADGEWSGKARDDRPAGSIQFLSATDRMRLAETRVRSAIIDSGTASLALHGGRARSMKGGEGAFLPFDRFSIKEAGIAAHADVGPGLALILTGNYSLMKRRPDLVWTSGRRRSTSMASAGLALGGADGSRLGIDYISVAPGSREGDARMAELIGGAPLAGTGVQLSFSGSGEMSGGNVLQWSLSGASLGRRASDSAFLGAREAGADRRISFNLRGTF